MQQVVEQFWVVVSDECDGDAEVATDLGQVALSELDCAPLTPVILAKKDADGVAVPTDESVALSGTTLTITEGETGLVAGDRFFVALTAGIPVLVAEVVEAGT